MMMMILEVMMIMMTNPTSYNQGLSAEHNFCALAQTYGYKVTPATREENINQHIDYYLEIHESTISVDVKSMKRLHRSGNIQDDWHAVEFIAVAHPSTTSVQYTAKLFNPIHPDFTSGSGRSGWVYSKATYIVFELQTEFLFVTPDALFELCIQKVNFHKHAASSIEAKYIVYSRPNRGDLFTFVHKNDLHHIASAIWRKSDNVNDTSLIEG